MGKQKTDWLADTNQGLPWLLISALYFMISVAVFAEVIGNAWTSPYGILYGIGFLGVGIVLSLKKSGMISALMASVIPLLATFASLAYLDVYIAMYLSIGLFGVLVANEMEWIKWKPKAENSKYFMYMPFLLWIVWAATYFMHRLYWSSPLPLATILNHAGLAILSFDGIMRLSVKKETPMTWLTYIGLGATIIGALWLTVGLGWGLQVQ